MLSGNALVPFNFSSGAARVSQQLHPNCAITTRKEFECNGDREEQFPRPSPKPCRPAIQLECTLSDSPRNKGGGPTKQSRGSGSGWGNRQKTQREPKMQNKTEGPENNST